MSVEIVGAMVALRESGSTPDHSAEALLVNSACRTLLNAPRRMIDAVTVSLPAGSEGRLSDLQAMCRRLATQHSLRVQMAVRETHLKVRITRPAEATSEGGLSVG
jgi:hypothetical protein